LDGTEDKRLVTLSTYRRYTNNCIYLSIRPVKTCSSYPQLSSEGIPIWNNSRKDTWHTDTHLMVSSMTTWVSWHQKG